MVIGSGNSDDKFGAKVKRGAGLTETIKKPRGIWKATCYDKDGNIKWQDKFENLVTNEGLDHLLDVTLSGASQNASWYIGLKGSGSPAAGDTLASHSGWSEDTNYSEANRQTWTDGGVSSQSVDNSGSPASFSINGTTTIHGAFLASVNSGTSGILYAVGDFSSSKSVDSGDTLEVTATFTMADDGA